MTCDIFIKSYPPDFQWLTYCLRSIAKFATGFRNIIICVPPNHGLRLTRELIVEVPGPESYLYQQVQKLYADNHSTADYILHVDSDCIFTEPVTPETFMEGDMVRWLMTPWKDCPEAKKAWAHVMVKLLQEMPTHDFMRKSTIMVPRFAYASFRDFIEKQTGHRMSAYVMNQPNNEFTEYNCLGFYLWLYHREKIAWHDTGTQGVPHPWEMQSWSWGGLTSEIRNKMEIALA